MLTAEEVQKTLDNLATRQQQIAAQIQQLTAQLNQVVGAQIAYREMLAKMERAQNADGVAPADEAKD